MNEIKLPDLPDSSRTDDSGANHFGEALEYTTNDLTSYARAAVEMDRARRVSFVDYQTISLTMGDYGVLREAVSAFQGMADARIVELEASNEAFGKRQEWWNSRMLELERELEELRKDAERYQFIRNKAQWLDGVPQAIIWRNDGHAQEICAEDELDEAIDAAIKEQTK